MLGFQLCIYISRLHAINRAHICAPKRVLNNCIWIDWLALIYTYVFTYRFFWKTPDFSGQFRTKVRNSPEKIQSFPENSGKFRSFPGKSGEIRSFPEKSRKFRSFPEKSGKSRSFLKVRKIPEKSENCNNSSYFWVIFEFFCKNSTFCGSPIDGRSSHLKQAWGDDVYSQDTQ